MASLSGRSVEGVSLDPLGLRDGIGLAEPVSDGRLSGARGIQTAIIALVFLHAVASFALPLNGSLNCVGVGGCYGVAAFAAYRRSRTAVGVIQARWRLVAVGLGLGLLAVTLPLYQDYVFNTPDTAAGMQDVVLLLRGVPFLAAVCLTEWELGSAFVALDLAQFSLLGFLASFAMLFAAPAYTPVSSYAALFWITAANVAIALFASVRCFDGADAEERGFFRLVTGFWWALTLATGWVNYYSAGHRELSAGSPVHMVCDLPLLALTVFLTTRRGSPDSKAESTREATFVDALCSVFIPICSLLLAASIVPHHVYLGLGGVVAGFLLYGIRSTVVLKKSLAAQQELLEANRSIHDQAFSDALTGIPNRRSFDLTLEREWKRAQRSRQPLALLMVDVDHFKGLNDKFGHPTGDACLRQVAGVLRGGLGREADFAARYGGEEFAILLIDTGLEGARTVAEMLRRMVELHRCAADDGTELAFTVSVGIASEVPMVQESSMTLVAAADKALYRAKRSGRNRVEVHAWRMDAVSTMTP